MFVVIFSGQHVSARGISSGNFLGVEYEPLPFLGYMPQGDGAVCAYGGRILRRFRFHPCESEIELLIYREHPGGDAAVPVKVLCQLPTQGGGDDVALEVVDPDELWGRRCRLVSRVERDLDADETEDAFECFDCLQC